MHQDWNPVYFNIKSKDNKSNNTKSINTNISKQQNDDTIVKLEAPKELGKTILQARNANNKTQKALAMELGINVNILTRWETNKELPSNSDIAKIEKILRCKLPRLNKKIL